jgi:hypothetical protein
MNTVWMEKDAKRNHVEARATMTLRTTMEAR